MEPGGFIAPFTTEHADYLGDQLIPVHTLNPCGGPAALHARRPPAAGG
jgi:hypothetical protein